MAKSKTKSIFPARKTTTVLVRMSEEEKALILERAKKYARGKIGPWMRFSAMNLTPNKGQLIDDD